MPFLTRLLMLLLLAPAPALAQSDYAREKRWADEITPSLLVGDPVQLEAAGRRFLAIYAPARKASAGVIVVHGLGVHPDWRLINVLRSQLADEGYATLSIQMPVLAADAPAEQYPPLFPEAAARLASAAKFLRGENYSRVAIVSHSLGARMSEYFLEQGGGAGIDAWVSIGLSGAYTGTARRGQPVLDLYGERDLPAVLKSAPERAAAIKQVRGSAQIEVPGADHFFTGQEAALLRHVKLFLDQRLK